MKTRSDFVIEQMERAGKHINYAPDGVRIVTLIAQQPYSCVTLADGSTRGTGMSKCNPKDPYDEEVGLTIATFRAMRNLKLAVINSLDGV